jgi:hypothetical protein
MSIFDSTKNTFMKIIIEIIFTGIGILGLIMCVYGLVICVKGFIREVIIGYDNDFGPF